MAIACSVASNAASAYRNCCRRSSRAIACIASNAAAKRASACCRRRSAFIRFAAIDRSNSGNRALRAFAHHIALLHGGQSGHEQRSACCNNATPSQHELLGTATAMSWWLTPCEVKP
jgi:hypothetical protein